MEKTLVFIDDGYLSKISKRFGNGKHIKVDIFEFATTLAKEQKLWVEKIVLSWHESVKGTNLEKQI